MKTIKKYLLPVIIIIIVIGLAAWKLSSNKKKIDADAEVATLKTIIFPVSIINPTYENITQDVTENGLFNPTKVLNFLSETSGRVTKLLVKKGQVVSAGSVVAYLDNDQIQIDLKFAETTLLKDKADMEKYLIMLSKNAINAQQIEDLKLTIANDETRIQSLKRQLKTTTVRAPISGSLNSLDIEIGSYLSPGTKIAEIVNITSLKMEVMLLDRDVLKIKVGQKAKVIADVYPNNSTKGIVTAISSVGDEARKFAVEVTFPNSSANPLKAGMSGKAIFAFGGTNKSLIIPSNCIVGSMQDAKVFVINDSIASLKSITIGHSEEDNIEVVNGLTENDNVVISGQLNITDGSKVTIIK